MARTRSIEHVDPTRAPWTWIVIAALAALALVQTARLGWRSFSTRLRLRAQMRRAARGERDAEPLLARAGYRVRGRQVRARLAYAIDGAPCEVEVRADYLVERDGREWVAEVKTGESAPRLSTRATRRQLLEYGHAFGAEGVLLVDPERERVHRIALPLRAQATKGPGRELAIFAIGLAIGALAAWAALR